MTKQLKIYKDKQKSIYSLYPADSIIFLVHEISNETRDKSDENRNDVI